MKIGDVAERAGTTPRTVRYYEEIGLLPGGTDRPAGAHRVYTEADVDRLIHILRLKELLGVSLEDLRMLVEITDADAARRALERVRARRAELEELERQLIARVEELA
ncbi:MAG: MerR family transcriptional regulator, repressor of the yfmOP operon [Solirubrobacteraceae bacterium]|jgi:DNA-binding transcriptional MerR regulator|nr:MerR family transcriptional regulator, repressor of the yfmOP operon [Solirubrobacteraceae bacterium]